MREVTLVALLWMAVGVAGSSDRNVNTITYGCVDPNAFTDSSPLFSAASTHYVPSYRPNQGSGQPDVVVVRVEPRRLIQLNDVEQSFTLDLKLITTWRDPRLEYDVQNNSTAVDSSTFRIPIRTGRDGEPDGSYTISSTPGNADPVRLWNPRMESSLNFLNPPIKLSELEMDLYMDGTVYSQELLRVEMSQRLDLSHYPFDKHTLTFTIMSSVHNQEEVTLQLLESASGDESWSVDPWLEGWTIINTTHDIGYKTLTGATGEDQNWEVYVLEIEVERSPYYYVLNMLLPMAIVMIMSSGAFFFEMNGLERRITVLMTAMLTMMAFNVYLGDMLPRVAYMTFLHQVSYGVYSCQVFALLFVLINHSLLHKLYLAADEDGNGEVTHTELRTYCYNQIKAERMHASLVQQGLHHSIDKESPPSTSVDASMGCNLRDVEMELDSNPLDACKGEGNGHVYDPDEKVDTGTGELAGGRVSSDMMDVDGDGKVSDMEARLWEALDRDHDGNTTMDELLEYTKAMPFADWTPFHVYVFLIYNGASREFASNCMTHGIHGKMLVMLDAEAFKELGMESAVMRIKFKFLIDDRKVAEPHAIMDTKRTFMERPRLVLAIVYFDLLLRGGLFLMWALLVLYFFLSGTTDAYTAGSFLGVEWNDSENCSENYKC